MKRLMGMVIAGALLAGCGARPAVQPVQAGPMVSSAEAGPRVSSAEAGPEAGVRLLAALQHLSPAEALAKKDQWGFPGLAVYCVGTEGAAPEATVLACQWGQGYNAMFDGRMLFWREAGTWKGQPYPAEAVRGVGYFERVYRHGDELIVIMNVARGMTAVTSQVQLLRTGAGGWQVAWLPAGDEWTKGHAEVVFPPDTFDRFTVNTDSYGMPGVFAESNAGDHRPFREDWVRSGAGYERTSLTELPSEYGAVVHFVTALVKGDDAEAARWASGPELVGQAKAAGILRSAQTGYFTRREGSTAAGWGPEGPKFRLLTVGTENPQWLVRVKKQGDGWVVDEIAPV